MAISIKSKVISTNTVILHKCANQSAKLKIETKRCGKIKPSKLFRTGQPRGWMPLLKATKRRAPCRLVTSIVGALLARTLPNQVPGRINDRWYQLRLDRMRLTRKISKSLEPK